MRLMMLFTVGLVFQLSATGFAQSVRMTGGEQTLKAVFGQVEKQTGKITLFSNNELDMNKTVRLEAKSFTLEDLYSQLLRGMGLTFEITDGYVVIRKVDEKSVKDEDVKSVTVVGRVTDTKRQPIPGVTVLVKEMSIGTATNAEGHYKLVVPTSVDTTFSLVFSFVGMETQTIKYNGLDTIDVTMKEEVKSMEEVVVTGYLNVDKGDYVGAVTSVKLEDIKIAGETSIDQMLAGVVPGMLVQNRSGLVGSSPKIRIRGTSTLLGNQDPVWVVDGVIQRDPYPMAEGDAALSGDIDDLRSIAANAISWLNPNDIETLTVLKDASATAIYGSKAANGVIVITTKKGRPGELTVSYSGSMTVGQRPSYGLYDRMNSQEMMQFSKEMYEERVSYYSEVLPIGFAGLVQRLNDKEITHEEMVEEFRKMEHENTDWFKILFHNNVSHSHSVSVYGGSEKIMNRTSFNISNTRGEAKGNDMANFSVTSNTTMQFGKSLQVNFLVNGSYRKTKGFAYGVSPFTYAYETSRVIPAYNEDGTLFYHEKWGNSSTAISGKSSYLYNILNEIDNTGNENTTKTFAPTLDVMLTIFPGLTYQGLFSYSLSSSTIKSWATECSFYITSIRGYEYGSVLANGPEEKATQLPFGGLLELQESSVRDYSFRNSLTYSKTFQDKHNITLQLGIEVTSNKITGSSSVNYGYLRDRGETFASLPHTYVPYYSTVDDENPLYESMRISKKVTNQTNNYVSEYFTGIYSYDSRYIVNFNSRLDASNRFGQDPDKKFRPTWSVGIKWRLGNEPFSAKWTWLNNFDLSASYGFQGNSVEGVSPYLIAADGGFSSYLKQYTLNIQYLPYDDLGWEKTRSWNFSVDFSFLNGRLNFVANWFGKDSDVLSSRNVPLENGVLTSYVFGSKMSNKGYELTVSTVPVRTEDFTWQLSVNTGQTKNKLTNNDRENTLNDYLNGTAIVDGKAYSTFYSYEFVGLNAETGAPLFNNMDIDETNDYLDFLVLSGKSEPDFSGGAFMSFRYKNLRLQANFSMQFGGQGRLPDFYQGTSGVQRGVPTPEQNLSRKLLERWRQPNDQTIYPALPGKGRSEIINLPTTTFLTTNPYTQYNLSDIRVADTDLIRCRQIVLTYELGSKVLERIKLKNLSFSATMANPFMIVFDKAWEGLDPETGDWPSRRTASLSLNLTF